MMGTMGERIAWARNQQGLILQQVSARSGLAVGYISQLEKGAKVNPTIDALNRLAKALNVSVAFLLGDVPAPPHGDAGSLLASGQAWTICQDFSRYIQEMSPEERERLQHETVEQRFSRVVDFLCQRYPTVYTRAVVAFQLGISVRGLNDILERNCEVGPMVLNQIVAITGIPLHFFAMGKLESCGALGRVTPAQVMAYLEAITMAASLNVKPDDLTALIRDFAARR